MVRVPSTPLTPAAMVSGMPHDAALRLRVAHLLSTAGLDVPTMPSSAVLLVRRLDDPLPHTLSVGAGDAPPPMAPRAWAVAAQDALAAAWRSASFPARGSVPAAANAVAFNDEGELLACAALAVAQGAGDRWWWRMVRGHDAPLDAPHVERMWVEQAASVPAACASLLTRYLQSTVLTIFAPESARQMLASMMRAFGGDLERVQPKREGNDRVTPPAAPWLPFVGEGAVPSSFDADHAALLGVALSLHRSPVAATRPAFAAQLAAWREHYLSSVRSVPAAPDPDEDARTHARAEHAVGDRAAEALVIDAPRLDDSPRRPRALADASPLDDGRIMVANMHAGSVDPAVSGPTTDFGGRTNTPRLDADLRTEPTDDERPLADARGERSTSSQLHTALGGVFFLVPVIRRLGLAQLPSPESPWGAWGWLDLLARGILRDSWDVEASDPIWRLLAVLDHRATTMLLGDPLEPAVARVAQGSLPPTQSRRRLPSSAAAIVPEGGHRLAEQAVAVAAEQLCDLLDCDSPSLVQRLMHRRAVVVASGASLDVRFALADARLDVRMAGLDADPGWIPVFGRVVRFHYVDRLPTTDGSDR